jgi:hypothetical protein
MSDGCQLQQGADTTNSSHRHEGLGSLASIWPHPNHFRSISEKRLLDERWGE